MTAVLKVIYGYSDTIRSVFISPFGERGTGWLFLVEYGEELKPQGGITVSESIPWNFFICENLRLRKTKSLFHPPAF